MGGRWAYGVNRRVVPDLLGLSFESAWGWREADRNQRNETRIPSDTGQGCEGYSRGWGSVASGVGLGGLCYWGSQGRPGKEMALSLSNERRVLGESCLDLTSANVRCV